MIPTNAYKIIQLRKNGYKPDELLIVSLVGKLDELNHVIYANQKDEYDWAWCKGLQICVFASSAVSWVKTVDAISKQYPAFLAVWDVDRHEGSEIYRSLILSSPDANLRHSQTKLDFINWCAIANRLFSGELCN